MATKPNKTEEKITPEKKFRAGVVTATIWANNNKVDGKDTVFHSVVLSRAYKDKQDNWQNTDNLRPSDIPKAQLVLSKAYEYLSMKQDEDVE